MIDKNQWEKIYSKETKAFLQDRNKGNFPRPHCSLSLCNLMNVFIKKKKKHIQREHLFVIKETESSSIMNAITQTKQCYHLEITVLDHMYMYTDEHTVQSL